MVVEYEYGVQHDHDELTLLYVTDTHFSAANPKSRKDNLLDTSLLKLDEVIALSREHRADAILHGGDFFEKPDTTDLVAGKVASRIKGLEVPMMVVPGGHDLYANNIDTVHRTKLGLFQKSGLVQLLIHPYQDRIIMKNKKLSVQLTGTASYYGIDRDHIEDDYILGEKNADYAIHIVHGMLMPARFIPGAPTVMIDDILATKADLTLAGHYHIGFDPVHKDGKWFANPGAMVRRKNDIKEIGRIPQVILIKISKARGIEMTFIPLKTAQAGEMVLDRSAIERRAQADVQVQGIMGEIRKTQAVQSVNLNAIVSQIGQKKNLSDRAVKLALDRIAKMQEQMGGR